MSLLLEKGRIALAIRPRLRQFLAAKPNKNKFINDLIEKEYQAKKG